ncbi:histone deacetylase complex subunit SAP30 homolog [Hydractinia symbiolongicarpus]|uniref:histone deacetylase complex subunit SAP30 homolog n=1 Tax=Hydractinia symbiolongicarpus TaxID=13093 RepID=UPI00254EBACD|nr:histone deacetylase complex subunit SAP30 homolog [Hydractinia symbiolongicarpus]
MTGDKDSRSDQTCCLVENGDRCRKQSGNASFNFRVQKLVEQRKLKFSLDSNAKHTYICDFHKNIIQKARNKRKRKESEDENDINEVDLSQLPVGTLRRYKRHYRIPTRPGMSKSQLIENIHKHFRTISVPEKETITYFIYMVKTHKSKLDQRPADTVI